MNNADYQNMPCISSHWLIDTLVSPAYCWQKNLDAERKIEPASDALRLGTLIHCLALTPRMLEREFHLIKESRRTKNGKAEWEWATCQGWTPIKPAELEKARAIVGALKAHKSANKLLTYGKKERIIIQPRAQGLLPLKARLDVHQESNRRVVELKTTWSLDTIQTAMTRYRYPLSAAFYRDLVKGQATTFVFIQSSEPYPVEIIEMSRADLEDGQMQWRTALEIFDACWKADEWPEMESSSIAADDDPLMLPPAPSTRASGRPRFDVPLGELAL